MSEWTEKHTAGIDNLFQGLCEALRGCTKRDEMKHRLDEMEWTYGPNPSIRIDSPSAMVQRALANMAMIHVLDEVQHKSLPDRRETEGDKQASYAAKKLNMPRGTRSGPDSLSTILGGQIGGNK